MGVIVDDGEPVLVDRPANRGVPTAEQEESRRQLIEGSSGSPVIEGVAQDDGGLEAPPAAVAVDTAPVPTPASTPAPLPGPAAGPVPAPATLPQVAIGAGAAAPSTSTPAGPVPPAAADIETAPAPTPASTPASLPGPASDPLPAAATPPAVTGAAPAVAVPFGPCRCGEHSTVTVEARFWAGINKEGGVGRIKKKHPDGSFDIKYLLGGGETKVHHTYVECVVTDGAAPRERKAPKVLSLEEEEEAEEKTEGTSSAKRHGGQKKAKSSKKKRKRETSKENGGGDGSGDVANDSKPKPKKSKAPKVPPLVVGPSKVKNNASAGPAKARKPSSGSKGGTSRAGGGSGGRGGGGGRGGRGSGGGSGAAVVDVIDLVCRDGSESSAPAAPRVVPQGPVVNPTRLLAFTAHVYDVFRKLGDNDSVGIAKFVAGINASLGAETPSFGDAEAREMIVRLDWENKIMLDDSDSVVHMV